MSGTVKVLRDLVAKISRGDRVGFEELASTINRGANEVERLTAALESANREAVSLANALHKRHYADESPSFELCDSVSGIITQIDNMTAGISEKLESANQRAEVNENKLDELESLRERLRPRMWPDEKPKHCQTVIHDGETVRFDSNGDDPDKWDNGSYCESCVDGDEWLPVPTESPDTGGEA